MLEILTFRVIFWDYLQPTYSFFGSEVRDRDDSFYFRQLEAGICNKYQYLWTLWLKLLSIKHKKLAVEAFCVSSWRLIWNGDQEQSYASWAYFAYIVLYCDPTANPLGQWQFGQDIEWRNSSSKLRPARNARPAAQHVEVWKCLQRGGGVNTGGLIALVAVPQRTAALEQIFRCCYSQALRLRLAELPPR